MVSLSEETYHLSSSRRRGSIDSHCVWCSAASHLTGDALVTAFPIHEFFSLKPQLDFPLSTLQWITGMDHIPLNNKHTALFYLQKWCTLEGYCSVLKFTVHTIRSNDNRLPAHMKTEISSDCACLSLSWVSMSHHHTWCLDYIVPFPHLNKNTTLCTNSLVEIYRDLLQLYTPNTVLSQWQ